MVCHNTPAEEISAMNKIARLHKLFRQREPEIDSHGGAGFFLYEGADIFLDFFTIYELQKLCVSIPEKLSDVVSSYQARTSEFPQEKFLRRGALSW
jgi:hypothetical protein